MLKNDNGLKYYFYLVNQIFSLKKNKFVNI